MLSKLLDGYPASQGRYDELLTAPGAPRPHWDTFLHSLSTRSCPGVGDSLSLMERQILWRSIRRPTSAAMHPTPDRRYITLAWGADFADVVPLRGVILGSGSQSMNVAVSVIPD